MTVVAATAARSKKQLLLDAALTLFVERGIEATATAQIAKTAGVANGTLFHHFANKAALVNALFAETKAQLAAGIELTNQLSAEIDLLQHSQRLWHNGMRWAIAHPLQLRFLQQMHYHPSDPNRQQTVQQLFAGVSQLLQLGQQQQLLAASPLALTEHLIHSQFLASAAFISELPKAQQSQAIDDSFMLFWRVIGGNTAQMQ
ncbi:TetR/AcrR family transcriptional regulator [Ferrimonas senticii]|uniref:TetR/AcrR family transcriptional regulator n=1 Tax=Ferrimonas senticii TaxID=394566 RepID=UPI00041ADC52|nr:TetR/AcrR family transcriptional regulator [Ferrimonas senticii]